MKSIKQSSSKQKNPSIKDYVCAENNCQSTKPNKNLPSKEPAMQSSFKKKHIPLCRDKNMSIYQVY